MTGKAIFVIPNLLAIFFCLAFQFTFSQVVQRDLSSEKWIFSQEGKIEFLSAKIPGTMHTDLFNNNKIPNPFFADNEKKLQWIENENWIYKTTFNISDDEFRHKNIDLIFNGLDTYADVFLNGKKILSADNMFRTWKKDVKTELKTGKNELSIIFYSASKKGKEFAAKLPYKLPENERVFVRKAQHHFGWDWGPRFVTAGIWKPVSLEMWDDVKIENVKFSQKIFADSANLDIQVEINSQKDELYLLKVNKEGIFTKLKKGKNTVNLPYNIINPKLWFPNGYGKQELYDIVVSINNTNAEILDSKKLKIGLRTVELIQEPDQFGKSFYFKVNGIPVYAKGANVIPPQAFLPSAEKNIYKKWMEEAKFANMNMLRIWGGGTYLDDEFYNEADRNGILVWQDFMFACAMYPGDEAFLENVKQEIIDQANRLQNHASLAIWCGNNENDEGWHNWGWQKQLNYTKQDSTKVWNDYVKLFRELIPKTLDSVSSQKTPYWQSSPSNGWGRDIAYKEGDVHYWGVWWGKEPFEKYREKTGRFVSEYGFQGMPPMETLRKFADPEDLNLNSAAVKNHQKHATGYETITEYMARDYKVPQKFEDFAYVSQLLQARGMQIAVEAHRQKKPYNMGTLYWQLNDVWPVTSWSSVDFYRKRKASHYQIRRSFEPVFLSVEETVESYNIWVNNDSNEDYGNGLDLELVDFYGKSLYIASVASFTPKLSNEIIFIIPKEDFAKFDLNKAVLKLVWKSDDKRASTLHFFGKPKDLALKKPNIKIKYLNENTIELSTDFLAKDVYLIDENAGNFSDNFFDLLPGETKKITSEFPVKKLEVKTLFDVN